MHSDYDKNTVSDCRYDGNVVLLRIFLLSLLFRSLMLTPMGFKLMFVLENCLVILAANVSSFSIALQVYCISTANRLQTLLCSDQQIAL